MSVNHKQTNINNAFSVTRRSFVKGSSALGALAVASTGLTLPFSKKAIAKKRQLNLMKKSFGHRVPSTVVAVVRYACTW